MHADLKGALKNLNKTYHLFEHNGKRMTKTHVRLILKYGIKQGYETTAELTDEEIDKIINNESETN